MLNSFFRGRARRHACAGILLLAAAAGCRDGTGSGGGGDSGVASVAVTGAPSGPLLSGGTVQLVASPVNSTGAAVSGQKVSWSSSDTLVATVSGQGLVSAVGAGPVTITATVREKQGAVTLDVRAGGQLGPDGGTLTLLGGAASLVLPANALVQTTTFVLRPAISPPAHARMVPGTTFELGPEGTMFNRLSTLSLRFDPARVPAGVEPSSLQLYMLSQGAWVAVRGSRVNVGARTVAGSITGSGTYAVIGTGAEQVFVHGTVAGGALYAGQTGQLGLVVLDMNRDTLHGRVATWASSDASRATVDGTGKVTAVASGTVSITATVDGKSATTQLQVMARPVPSWNQTEEWATFQGNAGHTGEIAATLDPAAFREQWTATVSAGTRLHPAASGDGKVFVSSDIYYGSQRLWALDAATGSQLWMREFGSISSLQAPAYGNGRVYVQTGGHQDSFLWSLDGGTGTLRFKTAYGNQWSSWLAPVVADSGVYAAGGYYGGMSRFNSTTGAVSYTMGRPQYDGWTPAVADGLVFSYGGGLTATHSRSGAAAYLIADNRLPQAGTPVVTASRYVLGTTSSSLFAVDLANRRVAWVQSGSGMSGTPASADGVIYLVANRQLEARKEIDGTLLWSWSPPEGEPQGTMIVTRNLLFVRTAANTYAVELSAKRHVWSYAASGHLAMTREGLLLISQTNGRVTAISVR